MINRPVVSELQNAQGLITSELLSDEVRRPIVSKIDASLRWDGNFIYLIFSKTGKLVVCF